ncbi:MAG: hypothetical protein M3N41_07400 [Acidobacteriota bacterium]|nr:hypothetical protein [Acidobacteriota bacterium]
MSNRRPIDPATEARLLTRSARRCCLCFHLTQDFTEKEGQLAHLDRDASNGSERNLVFLCLRHHSLYDSRTSQHKNYTTLEVRTARERLYQRVAELTEAGADFDDESEDPIEECQETALIRAGEHKTYPFSMLDGQELVGAISADGFIDIVVCEERDCEKWAELECEEEDDVPLPAHYFLAEEVRGRTLDIVVPKDGDFVVLLINWGDEDVEATIDCAIWPSEVEDED